MSNFKWQWEERIEGLERELAAAKAHKPTMDDVLEVFRETTKQYGELRERLYETEREREAARKELRDITAPLPETFYPELPLAKRVEYMAQVNTGLVLGNQQLQQERDALAAALQDAWEFIEDRSGDYDDEGRGEFDTWVDEHKGLDPKDILAAHDAAKDAEIAELRDQISVACADAESAGYYGDKLDSAIACFSARIAAQDAEIAALELELTEVHKDWDALFEEVEDYQKNLIKRTTERDDLAAKAAYWKHVADMYAIQVTGGPCAGDPEIEAWKATLVRPLVEALEHIAKMACWQTVLEQPAKADCKCYSCTARAALAPYTRCLCDGSGTVFDSPAVRCPGCKKEARA